MESSSSTSSPATIDTIAGIKNGDGFYANLSIIKSPQGIGVGSDGSVYIAETTPTSIYNDIRKINTTGIITTIAGTGVGGFNGDGPALQRNLYYPKSLAVDSSGDVYVAEPYSYIIRKIR